MSGLQEVFDKDFKDKRFQVKEYPQVISLGYYYVVNDTLEEMDDISFGSDWCEAEQFCIFINNLYEELGKQKMFKERFKESGEIFSNFFEKYEKSLETLMDKYLHVDESKYNVLIELDDLINRKED